MMRHTLPPASSVDWAFFLDVDGTLIDIAETPDAVQVDTALLDLIERLHRASGGAVALVSGRGISDLEQYIGMLRLPLAGQHGLERRDPAGYTQPLRLQSTRLKRLWYRCWRVTPACCLKIRD
jgi:trehalose 6-phosphate phosphatase